MNAKELQNHLDIYLAVRAALGFKDLALKKLLFDFVKYVISNNIYQPIRAKSVVDWACNSSATCGVSGQALRLSLARGFITYLQASSPDMEIPDKYLLASPKRRKPYIFTHNEIVKLMEVASSLSSNDCLRPYTYSTIIGLMACTGLRISEVVKLTVTVTDVFLDSQPAKICVLETKFNKSRLVPLHPSAVKQLQKYKKLRTKMGYAGLSDAFFVSEQGDHIQPQTFSKWFKRMTKRFNIHSRDGERSPTLHSLRHTFAVERLTEWCKQDIPVKELIPNLSVYLGHDSPEESYWYLTATPALLLTASDEFYNYSSRGKST